MMFGVEWQSCAVTDDSEKLQERVGHVMKAIVISSQTGREHFGGPVCDSRANKNKNLVYKQILCSL